jgi:RNA polymerase sigma-70 factor (ECF subfamily)
VTLGELTLPATVDESARRPVEKQAPFEQLVQQHQQMVQRVAYRLLGRLEDAQDAAQEVFLRLFRSWGRIGTDPRAWLYRVTVNVCNDHYRRKRVVVGIDSLGGRAAEDPAPDPESVLSGAERKRLVMEGLETLSGRERAAIVLRDIEGLSTAEVASMLGVEEVTVRSYAASARLKLAKYVRSRQ